MRIKQNRTKRGGMNRIPPPPMLVRQSRHDYILDEYLANHRIYRYDIDTLEQLLIPTSRLGRMLDNEREDADILRLLITSRLPSLKTPKNRARADTETADYNRNHHNQTYRTVVGQLNSEPTRVPRLTSLAHNLLPTDEIQRWRNRNRIFDDNLYSVRWANLGPKPTRTTPGRTTGRTTRRTPRSKSI